MSWIEEMFDALERFDRIYVFADMDDAGEKGFLTIAERLGRDRCFRVKLPHKDANKCLQEGVPAENIFLAISEAQTYDMEELQSAVRYAEEGWKYFSGFDESGIALPFGLPLRVRRGEWTMIVGLEGSGKTQVAYNILCSLVEQGSNGLICSFEMPPGLTAKCMVQIALANGSPSRPAYDAALQNFFADLLIYDHEGVANSKSVLKAIRYARKKYGIEWFIIDNMMQLGDIPEKDIEAQKTFAETIDSLCRDTGMHGFVVCHQRKGQRWQGKGAQENDTPDNDDISGSGTVKNKSWNILFVYRNKKLEWEIFRLKKESPDSVNLMAMLKKPNGKISLTKQRVPPGHLGSVDIWYHGDSGQYLEAYQQRAVPYYRQDKVKDPDPF